MAITDYPLTNCVACGKDTRNKCRICHECMDCSDHADPDDMPPDGYQVRKLSGLQSEQRPARPANRG